MANRAYLAVVITASAMSLVVFASSCSKKTVERGWKAEIEVVDGVKKIRKPQTPRYRTLAF